jgi:hypothetical protein
MATLFVVGFIKQFLHPDGLTPASLVAGILLAFAHLALAIIISAIPAAAVIWITKASTCPDRRSIHIKRRCDRLARPTPDHAMV